MRAFIAAARKNPTKISVKKWRMDLRVGNTSFEQAVEATCLTRCSSAIAHARFSWLLWTSRKTQLRMICHQARKQIR